MYDRMKFSFFDLERREFVEIKGLYLVYLGPESRKRNSVLCHAFLSPIGYHLFYFDGTWNSSFVKVA